MSKMSKLAAIPDYHPWELGLISALGGAGSFGAIRLLNDMMQKAYPPKPEDNSVQVMLPKPPMAAGPMEMATQENLPFESQKTAGMDSVPPAGVVPQPQAPAGFSPTDITPRPEESGYIKSILPIGIGLPAGFLGMKYMYDKYKEQEMNQEIEATKQQYLQQLQAAGKQIKTGSATPLVDKFCEAIALELSQ